MQEIIIFIDPGRTPLQQTIPLIFVPAKCLKETDMYRKLYGQLNVKTRRKLTR